MPRSFWDVEHAKQDRCTEVKISIPCPPELSPRRTTSVSRVKNANVGCRRNSVGSRTFQLLLLNSPYRPLGPSDENVSPLLWFLVSTVAFP